MKILKEELNRTKAERNDIQEEVKKLREEKEKMILEQAPIIFSLRSKEMLKLHLLQYDIKMVSLSEAMQQLRTTMINSLQELSKFKSNIENSDLEPFKTSILDKIENLRIKTGFVQQPLFDTIAKCKTLCDQVKILYEKLDNRHEEKKVESTPTTSTTKFVFGVKPSLKDLKNI